MVLLQLAKSSKDVPDTAVFKGDLDQVRTIAEQEEPEYEPRADTIRGGGALLRAMSASRTKREVSEARSLYSESMAPIGENEIVEWDGLRRRKTVLTNPNSQNTGSLRRAPTLHPPLGMSHFPEDDASEAGSDDVHPGFFPRFGRRSTRRNGRSRSRRDTPSPVPMSGLTITNPDIVEEDKQPREHVFGLPIGLRPQVDGANDTAYHSPGQHIRWGPDQQSPTRGADDTRPAPPPHKTSKSRVFSFQKQPADQRTFSFQRPPSSHQPGADAQTPPPKPRPLPFQRPRTASPAKLESEEERLGLVKGDSRSNLGYDSSPAASPDKALMHAQAAERECRLRVAASADTDDEWGLDGEQQRGRRDGRRGYQRGRYMDSDDEDLYGLGPVQRPQGPI